MSSESFNNDSTKKSSSSIPVENVLDYAVDVYLWKQDLQRKYTVVDPMASQEDLTPNTRHKCRIFLKKN